MMTEEQFIVMTAHVDERFDQLAAIVQQGLTSLFALSNRVTALENRFSPPPPWSREPSR